MVTPKLSVIVPTHGRVAFLAEALASIRESCEGRVTYEILVAAESPCAETGGVVCHVGGKLLAAGGYGASFGRNAGLRAAAGEYVAFLDDDDLLLGDGVAARVAFLDEHPEFGAVVAQAVNVDATATSRADPWPVELPADGDLRAAFLKYYPQIGGTMVRAAVAHAVGPFDESLVNTQDWEWHLRLATQTNIGFVATPAVLFRQRGDGASDALQWARLQSCTRVYHRGRKLVGWAAFPPHAAFQRLLQIRGAFAWYFGRSALQHAEAGEKRAAAGSIWRSVRASPPHAAVDLVRPSALRTACRLLVSRRAAGSR